jgi:acetyl-CoA C-acetyltransferase
VHFAAQGVMSGTQDLVVAGGLQNMSAIPISAAMIVGQQYGFSTPFAQSPGWQKRYGDQEVSQFHGAELIAEKWDSSREEMERLALTSHQRARRAIDEGRFEREIAPVTLPDDTVFSTDECVRDTSLEAMAALNTLVPGGRLTAGVSSQICDGSAALLIASEQAVKDHGLTPRARIHHMSVRGDDPVWMLTGPIRATKYALAKTGMSIDDIDLFECNEAFASVVLAWEKELDVPHEKVNVNGGAIALGHPIGATGARLMTTLLHELERTGGRYGLQTMCEGGGQANVTIIERL